jgi:hypothetical protein
MSIFNGFAFNKPKPPAPATTLADLEAKLHELMDSDPFDRVPALQDQRTVALLDDNYDEVDRIDEELRRAHRDAEKRALLIKQTQRDLERAQADEHAAEVEKRVAAAKEKADEMPQALAELERAFDLVREKLAVVEQINDAVAEANSLLPEGSKPTPRRPRNGQVQSLR